MLSIYLSMYNSSFSKASVLVAMYAFYLKHYVYTGAQARRPMPHATSPMSHAFIPPDARSTFKYLSQTNLAQNPPTEATVLRGLAAPVSA